LILHAIILGIIEGITEFLPISSTGHLIIANHFISFTGAFADTFDVVIQVGAILAVVILFWGKLFPRFSDKRQSKRVYKLWLKVIIGAVPAAVLGFKFEEFISSKLFFPKPVALALIVGAIVLLFVESKFDRVTVETTDEISYKDSFFVGIFQCFALWPGMSRSASTIIGGLFLGLSREAAAEFSFFLAIPTLLGAAVLKLAKSNLTFSSQEWMALGFGTAVSFLVALIVVAAFINYLKKKKLAPFAYYRIALGILVLIILR
jgi:undecaprenyl-diphosphatase